MSWWRSFLVHLLLAPIMPVLGWGFVTHALINRRAWRKAKASGKLPNVLASDAARHRFEAAGSLPDTISLYTLTSRDRTFDPLHNMHMVGGKRVPLFGLALLDAALEHWGPTVAVSAYGWCAHQLADSTAHYKGGFCTSLPTFRPAMGSYRPGAAGTARRRAADKVLADVDHGLVELLADAASAAAGHADPPLGDPDIDLPPDAVQQAWDAVGYAPIGIGQKWEALEAEFRSMLAAEVGLARALSRYEPGEQPVASAMETYYRDDGALKGYTSAVDAAVDLVADLLSTDQQVLRQEGRGRRLVPAAPGHRVAHWQRYVAVPAVCGPIAAPQPPGSAGSWSGTERGARVAARQRRHVGLSGPAAVRRNAARWPRYRDRGDQRGESTAPDRGPERDLAETRHGDSADGVTGASPTGLR